MDQRASYRCSRHKKMDHDYPECVAEARAAALRKKTGGRKPGSLNRKTIIGKNVQETLKNWLGFDDESVARTGKIDGKGYGGRLKLEAMWNQGRPVDPKFLALAKFLFSYGYGIPGRMPVEGRTNICFLTATESLVGCRSRAGPTRR
jgi:hypothetical protein